MCVNTHLRSPFRSTLIERFPAWSLMVIKAQDRLLKKFCLNAQHRRGPAEETQEVESQLLSTRAQKQLCAGVITQRKWSGRGNEPKSLECGRPAASGEERCAAALLNSITCVISVRRGNSKDMIQLDKSATCWQPVSLRQDAAV